MRELRASSSLSSSSWVFDSFDDVRVFYEDMTGILNFRVETAFASLRAMYHITTMMMMMMMMITTTR